MFFHSPALWIGFHIGVFILLALDLCVFHRKAHEIALREALYLSLFWIGVALAFNGGVAYFMGRQAGITFFNAYLIEKLLSVDNLFVFLMVFTFFDVPARYHHRLLFWGVLGAIVMRGVCILAGTALLNKFQWLTYLFALILFYTGFKMLFGAEKKVDFDKNLLVRTFKKFFPVVPGFGEGRFFVTRPDGKRAASMLFLVILVIESSDLLFAVDSIPAVLGITTDPFIAYSSNIAAILGLRALFFALAAMNNMFKYLQAGTAVVILLIAVKMMIHEVVHLSAPVTLGLTVFILAASVIASIVVPDKEKKPEELSPIP